MIKCIPVVIISISQFLLTSCSFAPGNQYELAEIPYAKMANNQNYCDGSPVIEIVYAERFRNAKHGFTLLRTEIKGKVFLETYISWHESIIDGYLNGSYVCLDAELLNGSSIFIGYGTQPRKNYLYGFRIDNMTSVYKKGKTVFEIY